MTRRPTGDAPAQPGGAFMVGVQAFLASCPAWDDGAHAWNPPCTPWFGADVHGCGTVSPSPTPVLYRPPSAQDLSCQIKGIQQISRSSSHPR